MWMRWCQRSFTNDDEALLGPIPTFYQWHSHWTLFAAGGRASVSQGAAYGLLHGDLFKAEVQRDPYLGVCQPLDDTTFLEGEDANGATSLLLPNRNLDHGYAKLDLAAATTCFRGWGFMGRRRI